MDRYKNIDDPMLARFDVRRINNHLLFCFFDHLFTEIDRQTGKARYREVIELK